MRLTIFLLALGLWGGAMQPATAQNAGAHSHVRGTDTASTRAFKAARMRMMRNMALPFTGDPDVDFRTHMIPHHQGAMDAARVALRYAKDPWTRQAAQAILIAQQQEIAQMQDWLARHGAKVPPGGQPPYIINANTYPDPDQPERTGRGVEERGSVEQLVGRTWAPGSGVPVQSEVSPGQMASNGAAATREFKAASARMMRANKSVPFTGDADVDFRTHMIPHHQGAIDMARVALRHARSPWTRQIAQAIITAQEQEIYKFRGWLARHGALASARD